MKEIMFTKMLQDKTIPQLAQIAHDWGLDGFDLCVRPDYPVNPDNAYEELPKAVEYMKSEGLAIPMVTGNFDLLTPDHPTAAPLLKAMDKADVRLLKLGYFKYDPWTMNYQVEVARVKAILKSWLPLARQYNVKICYHTHSNKNIGINGAAKAHLLEDLDPLYFGAYIDTGHLRAEGEDFATALGMVRPWLSIVSVKDMLVERITKANHGSTKNQWLSAGQGMVDWTYVFDCLRRVGFDGPVSIHCEFHDQGDPFMVRAQREAEFFRPFFQPKPAE